LAVLLPLLTPFAVAGDHPVQVNAQPNILLILLDDLGYNDLGANENTEIPTPNLDQLAHQGVRFTRHYTDSTCRPSRAALLTGKLPSRSAQPPHFIGLSPEIQILPEVLKRVGYKTFHIGKWHLGDTVQGAWPSAQGFDEWFGFLTQFLLRQTNDPDQSYSRPTYHDPWLQSNNSPRQAYKGHLTDILTRRAVNTIASLQGSQQPWFINLWYLAPHGPVQPASRYAERYPDTAKGRYYALVNQLDDAIEQVLKALDAGGISENTLVVVLSDNGGTNKAVDNNFPFFDRKVSFYEGGVRTPLLMRWPGVLPAGRVIDDIVSEVDIFPTLARAGKAEIPTDLDGIDLLDSISSARPRLTSTRHLFWELALDDYYAYSVLSPDGRWRLVNGQLFDLGQDPTGKIDVADTYPDVVGTLTKTYRGWQKQASMANVTFERLSASKGLLTGDSYRRSPGDGGFTFAIGVTPENITDQTETIAWHPDIWSMTLSKRGLEIAIGEVTLQAPVLAAGRCSTVVVSSYFQPSLLNPERRMATHQLYIDDRLVMTRTQPHYAPFPDSYTPPTLIGHSPGEMDFSGRLSAPLVHNGYLGTKLTTAGAWLPKPGKLPSAPAFLKEARNKLCE
jgi:arylsulfatase A-like enzyme